MDGNTLDLDIGGALPSMFSIDGTLDEVRISGVARSLGWINTSFMNQDDPSSFYSIGSEEREMVPASWWDTPGANAGSRASMSKEM